MEVFIWLILRLFSSSCVLFYPNVIAFFGRQHPSTRKYPDSSLIYFPNVVWSYLVPSKGFCPALRPPKCSNWFFLMYLPQTFTSISHFIPIINISSYIQETRADSNQEIAEKSKNKKWCLIFLRFVNKLIVCIVPSLNLEILTPNDRCPLIVSRSQFVNDNLTRGQRAPAISQSKSTKFWNSIIILTMLIFSK